VERHIGGVSETKPKYWSKLIAEREAGGQKVRPFCRERGITEPSFYYWRKRLRQRETVRFALLATKPADTGSQASALELVLRNGERLRIGNQVDAARLRIVLEAVRG
jgi:transposase-like protein